MARSLIFFGYLALLVAGWILFELQNVWPFNADRVLILRSLFSAFALASVGALLFARPRYLAPILAMAAFVATSMISRSAFSINYVVTTTLLIMVIALLTRLFGSPIKAR